MIFHWSLSDSKSSQVSRTHLRILAVLSNAVIWIVSTRPPTSKSSRPFNNPLVIVPKAPYYYYYYYYSPSDFFTPALVMVFHWSLGNSMFPLDSRTLLSILGDLWNAEVWMVSIRPPISNSSNHL